MLLFKMNIRNTFRICWSNQNTTTITEQERETPERRKHEMYLSSGQFHEDKPCVDKSHLSVYQVREDMTNSMQSKAVVFFLNVQILFFQYKYTKTCHMRSGPDLVSVVFLVFYCYCTSYRDFWDRASSYRNFHINRRWRTLYILLPLCLVVTPLSWGCTILDRVAILTEPKCTAHSSFRFFTSRLSSIGS